MKQYFKSIGLLFIGAALSVGAVEKPNIVFVMIDDLGAEQVGVYGGEMFKTPNIDAPAGEWCLWVTYRTR